MSAADYPAAHSMDAHWYTVDEKGNVAVFDPGSSGPVPTKAKLHEWPKLAPLVRQLGGPNLIPEGGDDNDFDSAEAYQKLAALGVFVYECVSSWTSFVDAYHREHRPRRPMHRDQLPPRLRKEFGRAPLPIPDFATAREVQIVEHVPCEFWWDEVVGYYAPGGKDVRPIPGREAEYRETVPQLSRESRYRKIRFADLPPPADKEEGSPKKGRKKS